MSIQKQTTATKIPALKADVLTLSWDEQALVAQDLSLELAEGEILCIVGRSGTGKTTLLHALAGLTYPRSGRVYLFGEEITGIPGHVSYMLQKDLLLPSKTVLDNICLPLVLRGVSREDAYAEARNYLDLFGLEASQRQWPRELSGGMRQRAALLRTYLMGNKVMLLDEPFSALDAITRTELRRWFQSICAELGLTAVVITHDVDEAVSLGKRILVLGGNPAQGVPSSFVGELDVELPTGSSDPLELSPAFIDAKRRALELLT